MKEKTGFESLEDAGNAPFVQRGMDNQTESVISYFPVGPPMVVLAFSQARTRGLPWVSIRSIRMTPGGLVDKAERRTTMIDD